MLLLLISFSTIPAIATKTNEKTTPDDPGIPDEPDDPDLVPRIVIRKGLSLRIRAIGLDPRIDDYVRVEYNFRRKGNDVLSYSVVGTSITITNIQFDRGFYTVTANIGGETATKSGYYFFGLHL